MLSHGKEVAMSNRRNVDLDQAWKMFSGQDVSLTRVASQLGISPPTLQRNLERHPEYLKEVKRRAFEGPKTGRRAYLKIYNDFCNENSG